MVDIARTLTHAWPGRRWRIDGDDYDALEWLDDGDPPSLAEIEEAAADLPEPVDIDGFLDAVDVEMGREFTRRMLKEFPDVERALSRGRIARAWAGLQDAYDGGHLTDGEWQTLVGLAAEHGISKPDDGEDDSET